MTGCLKRLQSYHNSPERPAFSITKGKKINVWQVFTFTHKCTQIQHIYPIFPSFLSNGKRCYRSHTVPADTSDASGSRNIFLLPSNLPPWFPLAKPSQKPFSKKSWKCSCRRQPPSMKNRASKGQQIDMRTKRQMTQPAQKMLTK